MRRLDFWRGLICSTAIVAATPAYCQDQVRHHVRLPTQPLDSSLRAVALVFGRNVSMPSDVVAGRSAPAIDGAYTFEEAVAAVLRGSGLEAIPTGRGMAIRQPRSSEGGGGDIVVTGTRIRGTSPAGEHVLAFDRKDIDQSGYATTQQIIQSLPQNFGGGPNEATFGFTVRNNANANFGSGASVNLRGLGATSTLTLIDGNRTALGGVAGTFVDLSLIPSSAIERIEVLPDGASAIYGSDAVAGVVNVKLRNDFRGAETRARFGAADGFDEWQVSQLIGAGWASGNITLGYEFYRRGNLAASGRPYATEDLQQFGGQDYRKNFSNPGTIIAANGQIFGIPAGQDGRNLTPGQLLAGEPNLADGRANTDILPRQDRHSLFASLSQSLTPWLRFTAQGFFADRRTLRRYLPDNYGYVVVPTANPFYVDPIGTRQPITVNYSFEKDLGAETFREAVRAWSGTAGLEATIGKWRAELRGSYGYQREDSLETNTPNYYYLAQALADPNPATAYNLFGDGSFTPKATIDRIRGWYDSRGFSRVRTAALKFDGPLFRLPGGDARMAIGGEVRGESYNAASTSYLFSATPSDTGSAGFPISRTVYAGYAELSLPIIGAGQHIPLVEALDVAIAGRVEHYSDFGTTTNPRVGVTWKLGGGLSLRGTWGTSFRAPSFADVRTGKGTALYLPLPVADPASPTGRSNVLALIGANPDVGPEKAKTWMIGATVAPDRVPGLKLDIGYFDITYRNRIGDLGTDYMSFLANRSLYQALITDNPSAAILTSYYSDQNFRNPYAIPANAIRAIVDGRTRNLSALHMNGLDFDLGYTTTLGTAAVSTGVSGTWIFHARQRITPTAPVTDVVSTIGNPADLRLRGRLIVSKGPWNAAGFVNFVDSYRNTAVIPAEPVSSWTTIDVQIGYDLGRVIAGTRLSLSVSNLFDRQPPFVENASVYSASGFDPENASPVGRMVALQVVKKW